MTLVSLLIVLSVERFAHLGKHWRIDYYLSCYQQFMLAHTGLSRFPYLLVALPALLLFGLLFWLDSSFVNLLVGSVVLMTSVGCPLLRQHYKDFLQAAGRDDRQACDLYSEQLGHQAQGETSFAQDLVWLNYRHYMAVVIFFIALGPAGALFYATARYFDEHLTNDSNGQNSSALSNLPELMHLLDWLPVRITALGMLVVGHFSRAFPVWLSLFSEPQLHAKRLLCQVARAAEEVDIDQDDLATEPQMLVKLAKRNMGFVLIVVSVLTLSGWIS